MSKYIQSFYQYPVTFSAIGKTVPSSYAKGEMKNIVEVSDKELERLQNCEPMFRELVNNKKYRILNHIPASYIPANEQINAANNKAESLKAENERLKAELAKLQAEKKVEKDDAEKEKSVELDYDKMEWKNLVALAKSKGIETNGKKKAAIIAELKELN